MVQGELGMVQGIKHPFLEPSLAKFSSSTLLDARLAFNNCRTSIF